MVFHPARAGTDSGFGFPVLAGIWIETFFSSRNLTEQSPSMDSDRKYRQPGYMDTDRDSRGFGADRPKPNGPRPPIDITGPRLPRLVQHVAAARCYNCATTLPPDVDFRGNCPKCNAELHCCKQCSHFEPSMRFQCLKPIPVRIATKDKANECNSFMPRVTVAREGTDNVPAAVPIDVGPPAPRNPEDARNAFDKLFKKL
jgi:hypothetical protein